MKRNMSNGGIDHRSASARNALEAARVPAGARGTATAAVVDALEDSKHTRREFVSERVGETIRFLVGESVDSRDAGGFVNLRRNAYALSRRVTDSDSSLTAFGNGRVLLEL